MLLGRSPKSFCFGLLVSEASYLRCFPPQTLNSLIYQPFTFLQLDMLSQPVRLSFLCKANFHFSASCFWCTWACAYTFWVSTYSSLLSKTFSPSHKSWLSAHLCVLRPSLLPMLDLVRTYNSGSVYLSSSIKWKRYTNTNHVFLT